MNRVNPIYIAIFLFSILFILLFKLNEIKSELRELKVSYKESLNLSQELSQLKKVYRQKLRLPASISSHITQKKIKNGVSISAEKLDLRTLNSLMSKVLNGAYKITELNVKRLNNTEVTLYMEIKW